MRSLCTKGTFIFSLALLVVGAAACTQSRPAVPTPTLVPLANETIVTSPSGQPTPIIVDNATSVPGEATLVVPPLGNETLVPAVGDTPVPQNGNEQPTPIIFEPTLLPTPTTVGDTGQPIATPTSGTEPNGQTTSGTCSNPYTVKPGEWFLLIVRNCGVTAEALRAANPGLNPNLLRPGQVLNIPGGGLAGGGSPPPSSDQGTQPPAPSNGSSFQPVCRPAGRHTLQYCHALRFHGACHSAGERHPGSGIYFPRTTTAYSIVHY